MNAIGSGLTGLIDGITIVLVTVITGIILWGFFRIFIKYKTATNEQEKKQAKHEAFEELKTVVLFIAIGAAIFVIWQLFASSVS